MPYFPAAATVLVEAEPLEARYYGLLKGFRSFTVRDDGATQAQAQAMIDAVSRLSTMGLQMWCFAGTSYSISLADVNILDELYSDNTTATLIWQDQTTPTNPQVEINLPAPNATIFDEANGVIVDPDDGEVAAAITAMNTYLNAGGANYDFVSGALQSATSAQKRPDPIIVDPTIGDLADPAAAP